MIVVGGVGGFVYYCGGGDCKLGLNSFIFHLFYLSQQLITIAFGFYTSIKVFMDWNLSKLSTTTTPYPPPLLYLVRFSPVLRIFSVFFFGSKLSIDY